MRVWETTFPKVSPGIIIFIFLNFRAHLGVRKYILKYTVIKYLVKCHVIHDFDIVINPLNSLPRLGF